MSRKLQYVIGGSIFITGGILQALFLISDKMMKSPVTYTEGIRGYKFNIGFHWTTLIGMLGVLMLVMGISVLLKAEKYVLGMTAIVTFLINISAWEFFLDTSRIYYDLVLGYDEKILWVYKILWILSILFMTALLMIMLCKQEKRIVRISYRILSAVVLSLSIACMIFKTICNQWYLAQTISVVFLTGIICSMKILLKRRKRNGGKMMEDHRGMDKKTMEYNRSENQKLGKYLCRILRHRPEVIGITLDEHGWADVEELIAGIAKTRVFNKAILEELVKTDNKQRYSFNEDQTKIRANQGHSIPVDLDLEVVEPPEILWHGTAEKYVDSIEKMGLRSGNRMYVHLSTDETTAERVGSRHGNPVLYKVKSGEMFRKGFRFYRSVNGVWLTIMVPLEYLEKI